MRQKLGLFKAHPDDHRLVELLMDTMQASRGDFTNIFRMLSQFSFLEDLVPSILKQTSGETPMEERQRLWVAWLMLYKNRLETELQSVHEGNFNKFQSRRLYLMNRHNPKYILRNYLAQEAIKEAEQGHYEKLKRLFEVLTDPYDHLGKHYEFAYDQLPPEWANKITLSCSS
jgi:uncharacterized protein YdiU (UPF0061 family)